MTSTMKPIRTGLFTEAKHLLWYRAAAFIISRTDSLCWQMTTSSVPPLEIPPQAGEQRIRNFVLSQSGTMDFPADSFYGRDLITSESLRPITPETLILDRLIRQGFPKIPIICTRQSGQMQNYIPWYICCLTGILTKASLLMCGRLPTVLP